MKAQDERTGVTFSLPWPPHTLSPNKRQHHMALYRAKKKYREACYLSTLSQRPSLAQYEASVSVELQFSPPDKRGYDQDNLVARMKSGLDGVADALGIDDQRFRLQAPLIGAVVKGGCVWVRLGRVKVA